MCTKNILNLEPNVRSGYKYITFRAELKAWIYDKYITFRAEFKAWIYDKYITFRAEFKAWIYNKYTTLRSKFKDWMEVRINCINWNIWLVYINPIEKYTINCTATICKNKDILC